MRRAAFASVLMALVLPAGAQASAPTTGRLLVSLDRHEGASAAAATLARAGARAVRGRAVPQVGLQVVRPAPGESRAALAARLRALPGVRAVDVEHRATPRLLPDDPALTVPESAPAAGGQPLEWWALRSGFPAAWDRSTGANAIVAVIDSGVDATHPELAGKIAGTEDLDPDYGDGPPTTDDDGHGTHVASLACAASNNGIGIAGAGLGCRLLVIKSNLTDSSVIRAIIDATNRGAAVINMSFGVDGSVQPPRGLVDAITYAYHHGVVLVAAAADAQTREQGYPANLLQPTGSGPSPDSGLGLSVTAAGFDDRRAPFAGYGSQISLAAYGSLTRPGHVNGLLGAFPENVTTAETGRTVPPSRPCGCRVTFGGARDYAYLEGTSMAAPIVSGAAALMKSLNPDLGAGDVIRILKQTAHHPAGWTPDLGWGIVDAGAAVAEAARTDRTPPQSRVRAPRTTHGRRVRLRIVVSDPAPPGVVASGVSRIRVYRSQGGGPPQLVRTTTRRSLPVRVQPGATYEFFTQAVDAQGNQEPLPPAGRFDARTRVIPR